MTFQIMWKLLWETLQASVFKIFAIYSMLPIWYSGEFMPEWMRGQKEAIKWVFHLGSRPHCSESVVWLCQDQWTTLSAEGLNPKLDVEHRSPSGKANALIALCQPLLPEGREVPYTVDYHPVKNHTQLYRHEWFSWDKTKPFQNYNSCCGYTVVSLWQAVPKPYWIFHRIVEP